MKRTRGSTGNGRGTWIIARWVGWALFGVGAGVWGDCCGARAKMAKNESGCAADFGQRRRMEGVQLGPYWND